MIELIHSPNYVLTKELISANHGYTIWTWVVQLK